VDAIVALIDGAGKIVFTGWEVAVKVCCLNAYEQLDSQTVMAQLPK
jgi:hypothetical protein